MLGPGFSAWTPRGPAHLQPGEARRFQILGGWMVSQHRQSAPGIFQPLQRLMSSHRLPLAPRLRVSRPSRPSRLSRLSQLSRPSRLSCQRKFSPQAGF